MVAQLKIYAGWSAYVVVFVVCLWPKPPQLPDGGDKTVHILAWLVVSLLLVSKFVGAWRWLVFLILSSLVIELVQPSVGRTFDWYDVLANAVGVVIGLPMGVWLSKKLNKSSQI